MTLLLTLAALTGWGYDGFAQDPARAVSARGAVSPIERREPIAPHLLAAERRPAAPAVTPPARPKTEALAPIAAAPTVWRLADARGQVWEHSDLNWLRQWVQQRNTATVVPTAPPISNATAPRIWNWNVAPSSYSSCPSGRCPRR